MTRWRTSDIARLQDQQQPQGWGNPQEPAKKPRKNEEDRIQAEFIRAFANRWPRLWHAKRLHACPNGAKRNAKEAALKKRTGMVAGVWDLQLTMPRGQYAGLFIEYKAGKNTLTEHQQAFQDEHKDDYAFAVCYTVEEGLKAVADYLALPAAFNSITIQ